MFSVAKNATLAVGKIKGSVKREFPFAIGSPAFIWQFLFFYLPLILMAFTSVVSLSSDGGFEGITFRHFSPLLRASYLSVIASSIGLAFSTAVLCLLIGYPLAYFITTTGKRFKTILLFLLIVPFWTNFLLHVYAWFFVLEREGFLNTLLIQLGVIHEPLHLLNNIFSVMLMMVYYYLPFMTLPLYSSLDRFDDRLLEASVDLGASWPQTFKTILLPLTMPAVRAGFFLVFIPAFGEFVIPELMGGDKRFFVGNVVSQYILGEQTEALGAAFTVLSSAILLIAVLALYWLLKKLSQSLARGAT